MKKRILSIDFDYFLDIDERTSSTKFPLGVDDAPQDVIKEEWEEAYKKYPHLKDIGIIFDYYKCGSLLIKLQKGKVFIAESHKDIAQLFPLVKDADELEVVNIDFHHDNYISGGSKVDCANWVRHLKELKPNADILWVRREDSVLSSFEGEFRYRHTTNIKDVKGDFDYIFLCYSPEWTPLHLRKHYNSLVGALGHLK